MLKLRFFAAVLLFILASCKASKIDDQDNIIPAKQLYDQGVNLIKERKYSKAADVFSNIYYQHPGGNITPYAELMESYSYYLDGKYEDAFDIVDSFIKLHPMHQDIAYAYYLKAMSLFEQMSDIHYDQSITISAIEALSDVITKYPNTAYAQDAKVKLLIAKDYLAAKNIDIGKYYLVARNNPIAAVNRFKEAVAANNDQTPESLYRLYESLLLLNLDQEAKFYSDKLLGDFPDSPWAAKLTKNNRAKASNAAKSVD